MDWQQWASLTVVAVAALALLRGRLRRPQFSFQRDTHCGCASASPSAIQSSIIYRARRGKPREVLVKMR